MSVDFRKDAHILAVHGVQLGDDESIKSDEKVRKLVTKSLSRSHLERQFEVSGFFYEDINDEAQRFYSKIASQFWSKSRNVFTKQNALSETTYEIYFFTFFSISFWPRRYFISKQKQASFIKRNRANCALPKIAY